MRPYPQEQTPRWDETITAAEWQGVAYPAEWNKQSKAGLLASLHEINYHSLANALSEPD